MAAGAGAPPAAAGPRPQAGGARDGGGHSLWVGGAVPFCGGGHSLSVGGVVPFCLKILNLYLSVVFAKIHQKFSRYAR